MLRVVFWILLLIVLFLLVRSRIQRMLRRARGLPEPRPEGMKTVNLTLIVILVVYGVLLSYRLLSEGWMH